MQKATPSRGRHSTGGLFVLTCPCRDCQATCKCSRQLHSLRQTQENWLKLCTLRPPPFCCQIWGRAAKVSIADYQNQNKINTALLFHLDQIAFIRSFSCQYFIVEILLPVNISYAAFQLLDLLAQCFALFSEQFFSFGDGFFPLQT